MSFRISTLVLISILYSCSSSTNQSNEVSYHFFRESGKIGIVDNKGNITCNPKFDGEIYYPIEFNNTIRSKFTSIFNEKTNRNHIIDIYGNEPFPNLKKLRKVDHGNLAFYFDDYKSNKGFHVVSLKDKIELGHYKKSRGINFHGATKYFYALIEDSKWKLFNEKGVKIYENGYILEVDVLEDRGEFNGIALSSGKTEFKYLDSEGKEISPSKDMENEFVRLQKQKEFDFNKDYDNYDSKIIPSDQYSENIKKYEVLKGVKYNSGEELYFVTKDNLTGVVDSGGKIIIEIKYDKVEKTYNMIKLHKKEKTGLADLKGKIIFQPIFKALRYEPYSARYIELVYDNYWFEADFNGRIFTPKNVNIE